MKDKKDYSYLRKKKHIENQYEIRRRKDKLFQLEKEFHDPDNKLDKYYDKINFPKGDKKRFHS